MTDATVTDVLAELAALDNPKARAVNARHGDDHGVNLSRLRAVAKRLGKRQELAVELWETDDTAARLVALLVSRPKAYTRDDLDRMLREARVPKVHDWLDLGALLDVIEAQMQGAPDRLQWAMNTCLAQIGIEHLEHRARALNIGERLGVLKDYPTPRGCTSPYAPVWIGEMVRRRGGVAASECQSPRRGIGTSHATSGPETATESRQWARSTFTALSVRCRRLPHVAIPARPVGPGPGTHASPR